MTGAKPRQSESLKDGVRIPGACPRPAAMKRVCVGGRRRGLVVRASNGGDDVPLMVKAARGEAIERPPCWYVLLFLRTAHLFGSLRHVVSCAFAG